MPNTIQAGFHRLREVRGLEKVTIRQKFSNHTLAFLDYRILSRHDYLMPPENTPVAVRWGSGPTGVRPFYGYVNHYETVNDDLGHAYTRMVLLGTSKTMKATNTTSWEGQSRSNIARDISARHKHRSVIHNHPYAVDFWASGTDSDWDSLKRLAEETGYRLWVDGATVWLLDPSRLVRTASSMTTPLIPRRDVSKIEVLGGSNIPGQVVGSTRRIQYGLDYRTNEFFEATSGSVGDPTEVVNSSATTFSEAQGLADAAERKQQDYYALRATVKGDARLTPGALARFESGRVNSDQAGLWVVAETTHEITRTDFSSKIVATRGRDQQPLSRRQDTVRGAAGLSQAVVRDGMTWEAALQEQVHG